MIIGFTHSLNSNPTARPERIRAERDLMYPVYALQVYDYNQEKWVPVAGQEASNRPHHYDVLRQAFDRLVSSARGGSPNQKPIGYRITSDGQPVDTWTNGKVPQ